MIQSVNHRSILAEKIKEVLEDQGFTSRIWSKYSDTHLVYMIKIYIKKDKQDHGSIAVSNHGSLVNNCFTEFRPKIQEIIDDFYRDGG